MTLEFLGGVRAFVGPALLTYEEVWTLTAFADVEEGAVTLWWVPDLEAGRELVGSNLGPPVRLPGLLLIRFPLRGLEVGRLAILEGGRSLMMV